MHSLHIAMTFALMGDFPQHMMGGMHSRMAGVLPTKDSNRETLKSPTQMSPHKFFRILLWCPGWQEEQEKNSEALPKPFFQTPVLSSIVVHGIVKN